MRNMNPKILNIINEVISEEIIQNTDLEAIILCGSHVTGQATKHSDIDLCYIGQYSEFTRDIIFYKKYEIQKMIAPWDWYIDVIGSYERTGNVGTITTMLAKGVCLWSKNITKCNKLQIDAIEYYNQGPTPLSEEEIIKIRRRITDILYDYIDARSGLKSTWILNHLLNLCVESHFLINNWWAVKTKYQIEELQKRDPVIVSYIEDCINKREEAIKNLCEYVLEPVGGLLIMEEE